MLPRKFNRLFRILILILVVLFLVGCKQINKEPVKIGIVMPLSGQYSDIGDSMKEGFELALDEINDGDGISGRMIKLIYEDDRCDKEIAKGLMEKLMSKDKVVAFSGFYCEKPVKAAAKFALDHKIAIVSSGVNLGKLTEYLFSSSFPIVRESHYIAIFAKNYLNLSNIGILYDNNDRSMLAAEAFKIKFEEASGTVTIHETTADYRDAIRKIKEKDSDGIFIASDYIINIMNYLKEIGFDGEILTYSDAESKNPKYLEEIYYPNSINNEKLISSQINFKSNYMTKYGKADFNAVTADSYDALNILVYGLRKCETIEFDGGCVSSVLRKIKDYQGAGGKFTFEKNMWGFDRGFIIKTVKDGEFVNYKEI